MEQLKKKRRFMLVLMCCMLLVNVIMILRPSAITFASTGEIISSDTNADSSAYGLVTKLSLTIGSDIATDNGSVWAKVHNDFTLGFSTIAVYVELYSSSTYQEDYTLMDLESMNYISDLNLNKTLQTSSKIDGRQRYWMARMRYKFDGNNWVVKTTATHLFDKDGHLIA